MNKLVLLLLPPLLLSASRATSQSPEMQSFCSLAIPSSVRVFNWASWNETYIQDQNLYLEPFRWDASHNIWKGYESDPPFDQPRDAYRHWNVTLLQADGTEQWIYILTSRSTPDTDYVYVFDSVRPSADSAGDHFGYHPCRAFAADAAVVNDWLHRVYHPNST